MRFVLIPTLLLIMTGTPHADDLDDPSGVACAPVATPLERGQAGCGDRDRDAADAASVHGAVRFEQMDTPQD